MKVKISICFLLILLLISCYRNEEKKRINPKFDLYEFLLNYEISEQSSDSLMRSKLVNDLAYKDSFSISIPRYLVLEYGNIFNNGHKYLIIEDQGKSSCYIWFKKTQNGFVKFYEKEDNDPSYIRDSIFDTNKDRTNEFVIYKHAGGKGNDYKIIHFLNSEGFIKNELIVVEK